MYQERTAEKQRSNQKDEQIRETKAKEKSKITQQIGVNKKEERIQIPMKITSSFPEKKKQRT